MRVATNIQWDIEDDDESIDLPTEIVLPADISDENAGDYLSDKVGFCHFGFSIERREE